MGILSKIIRRFVNIPSSIIFNIILFIKNTDNNRKSLIKEQNDLYRSHGLDREEGLKILNKICEEVFGYSYDENNEMFSEHLVMIASISLFDNNLENILEIGTHDGRAAAILSRLFPDSNIHSIDLPDQDETFLDSYSRQNSVNEFIRKRDELISGYKNINFEQVNSISMTKWNSGYDLIWVDGAHGYPVVTIDIVNSIRLLNKDGFMLLDDTWKHARKSDSMYKSIATYETLKEFKNAKVLDDFFLFRKRLSVKFNIKKHSEKFVSLIRG